MQSSGQKAFINTIRSALGRTPGQPPGGDDIFADPPADEINRTLARIKNRNDTDRRQLLASLIAAAAPINLNVTAVTDRAAATAAIAQLVQSTKPEWEGPKSLVAWEHPLIRSLDLPAALAAQKVPVHFSGPPSPSPEKLRRQITGAYIGVTSADFCMADTATLVMRTRVGQARSVSLVPSIHAAVIELDQIIADLKELFALLKYDPDCRREGLSNCMTFISGPSKTADIEATMVHGAHGPREVYVYVIKYRNTGKTRADGAAASHR